MKRFALLIAAASLVGCMNTPSPTEPTTSRIRITPRADCGFLIESTPAIEGTATWAIAENGVPKWNGTMTTPGLTVGVAQFTGRIDLTVTYRGDMTFSTTSCSYVGPFATSSLVTR